MNYQNINNVPVAGAINEADYLHITTSGGSFNRVLSSKLIDKAKSSSITAVNESLLDKLTDGCFIAYHRKSDNYPVAVKASSWSALQASGEVADGVLVISGGRHVIVAPTQAAKQMYWASDKVGVNPSAYNTDRELCFSDFDGKAKTAAILANETIGGDGVEFAPGYCNAYARTNGVDYTGTEHPEYGNYGLGAGKWWLPSIGELLLIYQNKQKINACLDLITGATRLTESYYWSSSEYSQTSAWPLTLSNAIMGSNGKSTSQYYVRAVTAFLR